MTIPEILAELCGFADRQERQGLYDCRDLPTDSLRAYADRVGEAYRELVDKIEKLSREMDGFQSGDCDSRTPSEEYLRDYAESMDEKYPPEEGHDDWLDDAKWCMDNCGDCGAEGCTAVRLRKLVRELKEGLTCQT